CAPFLCRFTSMSRLTWGSETAPGSLGALLRRGPLRSERDSHRTRLKQASRAAWTMLRRLIAGWLPIRLGAGDSEHGRADQLLQSADPPEVPVARRLEDSLS